MNLRHFGLLLLFSDVFCISDAVMTQSCVCIAISVLALFNQFILSQERIFGVIPQGIGNTEYTLLTPPRKRPAAEVFYAVVVDKSPTAIIMNKNFDIVKQLPASIFITNTQNITSKLKSSINVFPATESYKTYIPNASYFNTFSVRGNKDHSNVTIVPDMTALSPVKTEKFSSKHFAENGNLHSGEVKDTSAKIMTDQSSKAKADSVAALLLQAAEERLQELGYETSNVADKRNKNTYGKKRSFKRHSSKMPFFQPTAPKLKVVENMGNGRKIKYSKSRIKELLWPPEDIGSHRVIKQQGTYHQTDTPKSPTKPLTNNSGDVGKNKQNAEVKLFKRAKYTAEVPKFATFLRGYFSKAKVQNTAKGSDAWQSRKTVTNMNNKNFRSVAMPMDKILQLPQSNIIVSLQENTAAGVRVSSGLDKGSMIGIKEMAKTTLSPTTEIHEVEHAEIEGTTTPASAANTTAGNLLIALLKLRFNSLNKSNLVPRRRLPHNGIVENNRLYGKENMIK